MMAYPTESQKGLYIGIFWAIFNLGGVVGSAVAFGQNFHSTTNSGTSEQQLVHLSKQPDTFEISGQWDLRKEENQISFGASTYVLSDWFPSPHHHWVLHPFIHGESGKGDQN